MTNLLITSTARESFITRQIPKSVWKNSIEFCGGGTLCFSVYYKVFLLKHPAILKALTGILSRLFHVRGRGRETILDSGDPDEVVRFYDGIDNPIGKAFSMDELKMMLRDMFEIKEVTRMFFPSRFMPIPLPKGLKRRLNNKFGLMVVLRCRKTEWYYLITFSWTKKLQQNWNRFPRG